MAKASGGTKSSSWRTKIGEISAEEQLRMASKMKMTDEQEYAIYKQNVRIVTSMNSFALNRALNNGKGNLEKLTPEQKKAVSVTDDVISQNKTDRELILYRSNNSAFLNAVGELKVGSIYTTYGYTSASLSKKRNVSPIFTDGSQIHITVPKGSHALITTNTRESEVILPRNSRFRVTRVYSVDGVKNFDVELL